MNIEHKVHIMFSMENGKITKQDMAFAEALRFLAESKNYDKKKVASLANKTTRTIDYVLSFQRGMGKNTAFLLAEGLEKIN